MTASKFRDFAQVRLCLTKFSSGISVKGDADNQFRIPSGKA